MKTLLSIIAFISFTICTFSQRKDWSDWIYVQSDKPIQYSLKVEKTSGNIYTTKVRFRVDKTCNVYYSQADKMGYRISVNIAIYNPTTNNFPTTNNVQYYVKPSYEDKIWELGFPIDIVFNNGNGKTYFWDEASGLPKYNQNGEVKPYYLWTPCVTEHLVKESYNRCGFSFKMEEAKILE